MDYTILKKRREELSMSLQELSDKTGFSKSVLQRYENGTTKKIPIDRIEIISNVLGIDPFSLFSFDQASEVLETHINERERNPRPVSDTELKFALFGGEVTDEKLEEVKRFADYIKNRED